VVQRSNKQTDNQRLQADSIHIDEIVPDPDQPRKTFSPDELSNLAHSLAQTGQISPIVVRPGAEGKYVIVVGERRWRAAREVGLSHVECLIRNDLDEQKAREMQLTENSQREDIPPLEQAKSLKNYIERYRASQSEISRRTGIPQRTISDRLALLSLPTSVHARMEAGEIGPYEATKICSLPAEHQEAVAEVVSSGRISGRALEKLARLVRATPEKPIEDIVEELASLEAIQIPTDEAADLSNTKPRFTINDEIESDPETKLEKEVDKAELERRLPEVKALSKLDILVTTAEEMGFYRQGFCSYFKGDVCTFWSWESQESIPEGIGESVEDDNKWRIKPSELYCAMCTLDLEFRLAGVEGEVEANPLSGIRRDFKCSCGTTGFIAARVKCTKCGKEDCWGWRPEENSTV
jgi:ParB family chromosome partitioning protein